MYDLPVLRGFRSLRKVQKSSAAHWIFSVCFSLHRKKKKIIIGSFGVLKFFLFFSDYDSKENVHTSLKDVYSAEMVGGWN